MTLGHLSGFGSPSIITYHEPITIDLSTTHFVDCQFDEIKFPPLGEKNLSLYNRRKLSW